MSNADQAPLHLRIFLASPGDVADERARALKVLERLPDDPLLNDQVTLKAVAWDKPGAGAPMLATMTPQEAITQGLPKPSECDIVVAIFWARMGTPLPAEYTKPDGSPYQSGTEWEFLDAVQAAKQNGRPEVLLYRRTEQPKVDLSDPELTQKQQQWHQVEAFFQSLRNPDGSIQQGHNEYDTLDKFAQDLEHHLKGMIGRLLKSHEEIQEEASGQPKPTHPEPPPIDLKPYLRDLLNSNVCSLSHCCRCGRPASVTSHAGNVSDSTFRKCASCSNA